MPQGAITGQKRYAVYLLLFAGFLYVLGILIAGPFGEIPGNLPWYGVLFIVIGLYGLFHK